MRITVVYAGTEPGAAGPHVMRAHVTTSGTTHTVGLARGQWRCSCGDTDVTFYPVVPRARLVRAVDWGRPPKMHVTITSISGSGEKKP